MECMVKNLQNIKDGEVSQSIHYISKLMFFEGFELERNSCSQ